MSYFPLCGFKRIIFRNLFQRALRANLVLKCQKGRITVQPLRSPGRGHVRANLVLKCQKGRITVQPLRSPGRGHEEAQ